MARVNHKKVKQLIQQKRGKITDQEFFTSRLLGLHFEDVAAAQTKRYGASRRVRVRLLWQPDNTDLAYTDNLHITINAGNPAITEFPTREERYQMVLGLFAHELGHCLYTDFLTQQTYRNNLSACRCAPLPELMDRKKRDIMERKGDKEDENKRQKQQKESSAAAL